eukprot:3321846-Amphidinium_carterae.1
MSGRIDCLKMHKLSLNIQNFGLLCRYATVFAFDSTPCLPNTVSVGHKDKSSFAIAKTKVPQ